MIGYFCLRGARLDKILISFRILPFGFWLAPKSLNCPLFASLSEQFSRTHFASSSSRVMKIKKKTTLAGGGIARLDKILTYVSNFTLRVLACAKISNLFIVHFVHGTNLSNSLREFFISRICRKKKKTTLMGGFFFIGIARLDKSFTSFQLLPFGLRLTA